MKVTSFTPSPKTSFGLRMTIIHEEKNVDETIQQSRTRFGADASDCCLVQSAIPKNADADLRVCANPDFLI